MHGPPCSSGLEQSVSIVNVLVYVCCMYIMQIILVFKVHLPWHLLFTLPPHQTWCSPQSTTRDGATSRTPTTGIGTALTLDPSVTSLVTSRTVCERLASTWASTTASGSGTTHSTSRWVELGCTYNYIKSYIWLLPMTNMTVIWHRKNWSPLLPCLGGNVNKESYMYRCNHNYDKYASLYKTTPFISWWVVHYLASLWGRIANEGSTLYM